MLSPGTRCLYSAAKMHLDFIGKEDIIGNVCYATMASYRADEGGKNKRAPATAKADVDYLLTTKLFCGLCERMMIGESGTSHTGDKHYYYKCAGAKRKLGCKKKSVKKDFIERAAVILTVNRVLRDEEISRIADSILALQAGEDTTIPALKKQLADTERGIENMLNAIQQGVLTSSTK